MTHKCFKYCPTTYYGYRSSGIVFPFHVMKTHWGVAAELPSFLTSALNVMECSMSLPGHFTPTVVIKHGAGWALEPVWLVLEVEYIFIPYRDSNRGPLWPQSSHCTVSPVQTSHMAVGHKQQSFNSWSQNSPFGQPLTFIHCSHGRVYYELYPNIQFVPLRKHTVLLIECVLCSKMNGIYFKNHLEHINNTLCE